jgi:uncharacterized protein YegL
MPITLKSWLDRSSVRPLGDSKVTAVFEIAARGKGVDAVRPRGRTVLALDVSRSMKGQPLAHVIKSVDRILDALNEDDEVGIVAFSNQATRLVEPVRLDIAGKKLIRSRVGRLGAEAGTNIEAGLNVSAAMHVDMPANLRRGVILLSDGAPNVGVHTADGLREVVKKHKPNGIAFFALGYGPDHSEDVLSAVSEGGYEYIADPANCARSFARALGAQGDVVASDIKLVLAPAPGVELVRFVGKESTAYSSSGVEVSLPDMVGGANRLVAAELRVKNPGGDRFSMKLLEVTVSSKEDAHEGQVKADATIEIGDREPLVIVEGARHVLLLRAEEVRQEARALADCGHFSIAATTLRKVMAEITEVPGFVANDGSQLAEAYELLVDEVMVYERRPDPEQYGMYRKMTMSTRLGNTAPISAKARGDRSSKLIMQIAGDMPEAWLINDVGARFNLEEECVIGRTGEADIQLMHSGVSRRHAEIFANAGDFWIADLGSTNPTMVNGQRIGATPHKLTDGDVIEIGDSKLRYHQAPRQTH